MSVKFPSLVPHAMLSVMVTNTEKSIRDTHTQTQTQLQGQSHKTAYRAGTDSDSCHREGRGHSDAENANVDLLLFK